MQHAYSSHNTSFKSFNHKTGWHVLLTAQCAGMTRTWNGLTCAWTFLWWSCALYLLRFAWACWETCPVSAMHSYFILVPSHIPCRRTCLSSGRGGIDIPVGQLASKGPVCIYTYVQKPLHKHVCTQTHLQTYTQTCICICTCNIHSETYI